MRHSMRFGLGLAAMVLVMAMALAGCDADRAVPKGGGTAAPSGPPRADGSAPRRNGPAPAVDFSGAKFRSGCRFTHRAPDDPIVHQGMSGMSHSHDFFANTSTDANSTLESLRAAPTQCRDRADTAAYWVPTLYSNGQAVTPLHSTAYYLTGRKDHTKIQAFPSGLKVVAGNARATSAQSLRVTGWDCGTQGGVRSQSTVPTCSQPTLRLRVTFPDCWNGVDLDSSDHASHLAYSDRGLCPSTHPVMVPQLMLLVRYPITGGDRVTLASGSPITAHGDFFNAWNQLVLEAHVRDCINAGVDCTLPPR